MGIKNHNTKREKNVMIKRLRIAVFIAVSLGIVLIVFRYFGFVSKTIYEESVSHLTEVFHQSDNMLRELTCLLYTSSLLGRQLKKIKLFI